MSRRTRRMLIVAAIIGAPFGLWLVYGIYLFYVLALEAIKGFGWVIKHAAGGR